MGLTRKDLLDIRSLEPGEIRTILDNAASMKEIASREIKKVPALRGKTVVNMFMEPSTRTRTSFEIAGKWLSADVINVSGSSSSVRYQRGSGSTRGRSPTRRHVCRSSDSAIPMRWSSVANSPANWSDSMSRPVRRSTSSPPSIAFFAAAYANAGPWANGST